MSNCVCCGKTETRVIDVPTNDIKKHLVPAIPRVIQEDGCHRIILCASCNHLIWYKAAIIKELRYQNLLKKGANQAFR